MTTASTNHCPSTSSQRTVLRGPTTRPCKRKKAPCVAALCCRHHLSEVSISQPDELVNDDVKYRGVLMEDLEKAFLVDLEMLHQCVDLQQPRLAGIVAGVAVAIGFAAQRQVRPLEDAVVS